MRNPFSRKRQMSTSDKDIKAEDLPQNPAPETEAGNETLTDGPEAQTDASASQLAKAEEQITDLKDKYLRLFSEFDNFRKRTAKEKLDMQQTASESLMVALLPIIDDFERAIKASENATDIAAVKEGVDLVYKKMLHILQQRGLKPMQAQGVAFDSDIHEAIAQVPAGDDKRNQVIEVVEKGYYLHEKPIRVAKVVTGA